jgi:hypothetical protein
MTDSFIKLLLNNDLSSSFSNGLINVQHYYELGMFHCRFRTLNIT